MRAHLSLFTLLYAIPIITFSQHINGSWKLDSTFIKRLEDNGNWSKRKMRDNTTIAFKRNGKYRWITYSDLDVKVTYDSGTLRVSYRSEGVSNENKKQRMKKTVEHGTYEIKGDSLLLSEGGHWRFSMAQGCLYLQSIVDFFEPPRMYSLVFVRKRSDALNDVN